MTPRIPARAPLRAAAVLVAVVVAGACESRSPTPPTGLRFGQVGAVTVDLVTPLSAGLGSLAQSIHWESNGVWIYDEAVSYDGSLGDANRSRISINPEASAGLYSEWIFQVNDVAGIELFIPELDPSLVPNCGTNQAILTLTIEDRARGETVSWTRCGIGPLESLTPAGSGPEPAASRVFAAAEQARRLTLNVNGTEFRSAYSGTVPFGTLDRGAAVDSDLVAPAAITTNAEYQAFWSRHRGGSAPVVDFDREVVLVAAVGQRTEAGTTVEIRRILPVEGGTFVEAVEQVPGDFCSPAGLRRTPFHIVVAPKVPPPIRFTAIQVERIPCG